MMILVMAVLAVFTFYAFIFVKNQIAREVLGFTGVLLLLGAVGLTTLNFNAHWGMKKVTTTQTKNIYSAAPDQLPVKLLITQEIGTKADDYVMVYRDNANDKQAKAHFVPNKSDMNQLIHTIARYEFKAVNQATVTTETTRWRFDSDLSRWLFGFTGIDGSLVKKEHLVTLPKQGWQAMTAKEAQAMQAQMAAKMAH
ncbi:DUF4811 domain-containing protein [Weissella diestrammenae]|uniref:DUF4811 domain-containing protein n=1 Tax=Weissella diestrammenae TaxID=1162633 RepID=A0A7G9T676_9LACO|nr:DUF4811 domain-containing protein [Weissella diestrammenae]MCM0583356.1 DUF4811 domain-containing protein [Weissella diestrammenae]QNN75601.1 DUF4811 domain-containing protein [Weissella diestrammenae]